MDTEDRPLTEDELYIFNLSPKRLEVTPFDVKKWECCHVGCNRYTKVKDYGISPFFHWRKKFINLDKTVLYCAKHYQYFKRVPSKFKYKEGSGLTHLKPLK